MENNNADAQFDVLEQEEATSQESNTTDSDNFADDDVVTISKSKFNHLDRKARAYDATKDKPQTLINKQPSDEKWKQRMELKVEGYDDEAIDFLLKNGGKKALENQYIVAAVDAMKTKKAAEAAILGGEGQKSSVEKRFTPGEFSRLSSEEQLKALSELNR